MVLWMLQNLILIIFTITVLVSLKILEKIIPNSHRQATANFLCYPYVYQFYYIVMQSNVVSSLFGGNCPVFILYASVSQQLAFWSEMVCRCPFFRQHYETRPVLIFRGCSTSPPICYLAPPILSAPSVIHRDPIACLFTSRLPFPAWPRSEAPWKSSFSLKRKRSYPRHLMPSSSPFLRAFVQNNAKEVACN